VERHDCLQGQLNSVSWIKYCPSLKPS
jgi:hypothetical protein